MTLLCLEGCVSKNGTMEEQEHGPLGRIMILILIYIYWFNVPNDIDDKEGTKATTAKETPTLSSPIVYSCGPN